MALGAVARGADPAGTRGGRSTTTAMSGATTVMRTTITVARAAMMGGRSQQSWLSTTSWAEACLRADAPASLAAGRAHKSHHPRCRYPFMLEE